MIINEFLRHFVRVLVIAIFQRERLQSGRRLHLHRDFMDLLGTAEHLADFDPRPARGLIIIIRVFVPTLQRNT